MGATLVAVAVGLVVLVISFGFVIWASKDDQDQKGHGQRGQGQKRNY
jgi:hypothetical protein